MALAWTLLCLTRFANPYLWIFPSWILACFIAFVSIIRPAVKAIFVNIAAIFFVLWIFEWYAYAVVRGSEQSITTYSKPYWVKDPVLGIAPMKGIIARSKNMFKDNVIYDVIYTVGSNGLRVSPPNNESQLQGCALFFGCSFTYGVGLSDNLAMPYRVGVHTQEKYKTYNFGFHGYGPHHMLAALEQGVVDQAVQCRPTHAIYQAIYDHVARASGLPLYSRHSPRYRLLANGSVKREGFFDDEDVPPGPILAQLQWQYSKSNISTWLKNRRRGIKDSELDLFFAIVKTSERDIVRKFPGCKFHVILWDPLDLEPGTKNKFLKGFQAEGLQVHLVSDILPDYIMNPHQYEINEHDRHPNARANDLIAEYVAQRIFKYN